jgi:fucose 4-O-acetylase-like acetyltransferase
MQAQGTVRQRIEYIDTVRGIGILLMVMGHIGFGGLFDKYIHAFHMPMFFVISGFLYRESDRSTGSIIARRAKALLIPYLVYGALNYIVWLALNRGGGVPLLTPLRSLFFTNTDNYMPIAGALWFLTCLFITESAFLALRRALRSTGVLAAVIGSIGILGLFIKEVLGFRLPYGLDTAMTALALYFAGYLLNTQKNAATARALNLRWPWLLLAFALLSGVILVNGYVNTRLCQYGNGVLFYVAAIGMTIALFNAARLAERWEVPPVRFLKRELKYVGAHSLMYLCLNQLMILMFSSLFQFAASGPSKLILLAVRCAVLLFTMASIKLVSEIKERVAARGRAAA